MEYKNIELPVKWFLDHYKNQTLDLSPAFQRDSVWNKKQRGKLIETIIQKLPIPAVFIAKNGREYLVLDGKQRLEAILYFLKIKRTKHEKRPITVSLNDDENKKYSYAELKKHYPRLLKSIENYNIPCIKITEGELEELTDLFVRINTTGKQLRPGEILHAQIFNPQNYFLREASKLANKLGKGKKSFFRSQGIFTEQKINRMEHLGFICELMASIQMGQVLDGKNQIKIIIDNKGNHHKSIDKARRNLETSIKVLKEWLPELTSTRFRHKTNLYSLLVLIAKFRENNYNLGDKKKNKIINDFLTKFSTQIDMIAENKKGKENFKRVNPLARQYFDAENQKTNSKSQRQTREDILKKILKPLLTQKDMNRAFTEEQRRIIWNSTQEKKCEYCGEPITYASYTADHIKAHANGGKKNKMRQWTDFVPILQF